MANYFRNEPDRSYSISGWKPYGAGDLFALDARVDSDFSGNVTEQLLSEGYFIRSDGQMFDRQGDYVCQFEAVRNA